jgi:transcriptional regulator with XRE-family HTH domain
MVEQTPHRTKAQPTEERSAFAEKLEAAIRSKGWSLAETARQVNRLLPEGQRFNPVNLTHYLQGRSQPRARFREALLAVLDMEDAPKTEVITKGQVPAPDALKPVPAHNDVIRIEDLGQGKVRLSIEVVTSWPKAIALLESLKQGQE